VSSGSKRQHLFTMNVAGIANGAKKILATIDGTTGVQLARRKFDGGAW